MAGQFEGPVLEDAPTLQWATEVAAAVVADLRCTVCDGPFSGDAEPWSLAFVMRGAEVVAIGGTHTACSYRVASMDREQLAARFVVERAVSKVLPWRRGSGDT